MGKGILRHSHINEKGVAIATAMSVVLILALLGAGLLLLSMREMNISLKSESSNQAFHVAEAGVEYATNKISNGEIVTNYPDTTVSFGAGEFVVSIDREVDYNTPQVTYSITSVGIVEDSQATETSWLPSLINEIIPVAFAADNQKTIQVEMKQTKPFTEYVFFMDEKQDPDNYNFISCKPGDPVGDEVTGSVHANGHNYITSTSTYDLSIYSVADGYPKFNGLVSYVNEINVNGKSYVDYSETSGPYFNPKPAKVDEVAFPATNDYTFLEGKAGNGWVLHGNTTITLKDNNPSSNDNNSTLEIVNDGINIPPLTLSSGNGVLYVKNGDVSVSGTLDGSLTIVSAGGGTSEGNIKIVGDITYAKEDIIPSETASDDMLGLIAEKDIYIPYNSAPSDISINAIMLAQNGSIWYEDWDSSSTMGGGGGGMVSKGILAVNGSLIQKTDFGDASGTTGKGKHFGYTWGMVDKSKEGYYKNLNYDERLHYLEPPYFFKPNRSLYKITWK